ncbi:MAG: hypothetical protein B7Z43_07465, partial [Sphingomonas sp. 12-62-6]
RGITGLVKFQFSIDTAGRANSCFITQSSGNVDLDRTTCQLIVRRGRFRPLRNDQGEPITTKGRSQVLWTL